MLEIDRNSPIPIQHQLYSVLKDWFVSGFTEEDTLPTEIAIAGKYNVSRGTVRIAMDNLVKEGLICRISGKGSFLTKKFYIQLNKYKIGVILSEIDFFTNSIWEYTWSTHLEIINGIIRSNIECNVSTELISEKYIPLADNADFDGFIVWPYVHQDVIDKLEQPYVLLNYEIDMKSGFSRLAEDLIRNKYRDIAYIGFTAGGRIETINSVLEANNSDIISSGNIFECGGNPKEAYRSCSRLFKANPEVDCIICSTDLRAQGVIEYLSEIGIRIPEKVSVYGFDGSREISNTDVQITTCSFDWTYPGSFAVKKIRAILDKRKIPEYTPPEGLFILRNSTKQ